MAKGTIPSWTATGSACTTPTTGNNFTHTNVYVEGGVTATYWDSPQYGWRCHRPPTSLHERRAMRFRMCLLLFAGTVCGIQGQSQARPAGPIETTVENYGVTTFLFNRTSGSLVLAGECVRSPEGDVVATGRVRILEPSAVKNPGESLDRLTAVNPHITWSRASDGLVQVRDDRASAGILGINLPHIELKDVVSLADGLNQILSVPEIKTYLDRNHISMPVVLFSNTPWNDDADRSLKKNPGAPKYSQTMTNVTLEEALNSVVRAIPGVWVYSQCSGRIMIKADPTGSPSWERIQAQTKK